MTERWLRRAQCYAPLSRHSPASLLRITSVLLPGASQEPLNSETMKVMVGVFSWCLVSGRGLSISMPWDSQVKPWYSLSLGLHSWAADWSLKGWVGDFHWRQMVLLLPVLFFFSILNLSGSLRTEFSFSVPSVYCGDFLGRKSGRYLLAKEYIYFSSPSSPSLSLLLPALDQAFCYRWVLDIANNKSLCSLPGAPQ